MVDWNKLKEQYVSKNALFLHFNLMGVCYHRFRTQEPPNNFLLERNNNMIKFKCGRIGLTTNAKVERFFFQMIRE